MLPTEAIVKTALASTIRFITEDQIEPQHFLREDLHLDSMGSLMFLMKLEEMIEGFSVDPETLQMKDLETVSSIVSYIDIHMTTRKENVHQ